MKTLDSEQVCFICGKRLSGYRNNLRPPKSLFTCCNECYKDVVLALFKNRIDKCDWGIEYGGKE